MRNKVYLLSYIALTALYVSLSLGLASDPKILDRYNITQSHAHLINLAIVFPLLLVWAAALYGLLRLRSYSKTITNTPEGIPVSQLTTGLAVLAFSLPFLASYTSITNYTGWHRPDLLPTLTIVKNYLNLAFLAVAFFYIYKGAQGLAGTLKRKAAVQSTSWTLLGTIILTSLYIWLITTRTQGEAGDVSYYMPNWLIISTLAIPYIYMWCKGIQAATYIKTYQRKIKGKTYKHSLQNLANGIITIIIISTLIQFIATSAERLTRLKLTPLLGIVYILVALYAVGYGLVAKGAKKLKLIEEA
jgi:hypothetical protein